MNSSGPTPQWNGKISDVDYHLMKRRTYEWWCFPPHTQGKCFHCRDRSVNHKQHPGWIAGFFIHIPTSGGWRGKCNLAKGCIAKMQGCLMYKREAKHSQQCTTVCYSHYYLFMHNWACKKPGEFWYRKKAEMIKHFGWTTTIFRNILQNVIIIESSWTDNDL